MKVTKGAIVFTRAIRIIPLNVVFTLEVVASTVESVVLSAIVCPSLRAMANDLCRIIFALVLLRVLFGVVQHFLMRE